MILGFDIGGTKCAVVLAKETKEGINFLQREEIPTEKNWKNTLDSLIDMGIKMLKDVDGQKSQYKIGISCGGPLDNKKGIIKSPPNLPGWDDVPIIDYIYDKLGVKAKLQNDADACALAEWKYGAGKGLTNMIFLTFGTGLGAGLILNGKLYTGASNMAGEVGHIRLADDGPTGYGKSGSFEGFCSGGGIAQLGQRVATDLEKQGRKASFCRGNIQEITAKDVAESAKEGHKDALEVFEISGRYFGKGLSILIDILNPELIVVGSIYTRAEKYLAPSMHKEIIKESLKDSRDHARIVPAKLGEQIGDYGAVVTALI